MYTIDNLPEYIYIGNSKKIYNVDIDISSWITQYGTSAIGIYFIPPTKLEEEGDFVNTTLVGNTLTWNVVESDIAILGRGRAVLVLNGNNKIRKSDTITVIIQ